MPHCTHTPHVHSDGTRQCPVTRSVTVGRVSRVSLVCVSRSVYLWLYVTVIDPCVCNCCDACELRIITVKTRPYTRVQRLCLITAVKHVDSLSERECLLEFRESDLAARWSAGSTPQCSDAHVRLPRGTTRVGLVVRYTRYVQLCLQRPREYCMWSVGVVRCTLAPVAVARRRERRSGQQGTGKRRHRARVQEQAR